MKTSRTKFFSIIAIIFGVCCTTFILSSFSFYAAPESYKANMIINADLGKNVISRNIYGQFSEHLGHCIYGGFWVGENSKIPNVRGIRTDVVEALKKVDIPNLRWPGGCFADEYHWRDGIGPNNTRPTMINTNWGGVTEDNSFGTHEFLDLCEQMGTEPYICGNVGSGSVEEMSKWIEYINFDGVSPMADLRKKNGHEKPWKVKFWSVGNENWGCGGNMTAEFYSDQYKRYASYCKNYGNNQLLKVACGPGGDDFHWTETVMKNIPSWMMWGISLHNYTVVDWSHKGSATQFSEKEYFDVLSCCYNVTKSIDKHLAIMDRYDPEKKVALAVDEWGVWYDVEPGTNPGFLFQQNSLRDAFVAGISLNAFNQRCSRIKMANIAQIINVLQSLILTKDDKIVLTPTYHVFEMFKVHHDATLLPSVLNCADYEFDGKKIPALSSSVSKDKNGNIHISLVNIDPKKSVVLTTDIRGTIVKEVNGRILTAPEINSYNSFEKSEVVKPTEFNKATLKDNTLTVEIPAKSIVVLELK